METSIYFGPPGTGKTARLLGIAQDELARGSRVAFLSFSRRAAAEARERARADLGLDDDQLKWWGTLHSTAARRLGVTPGELMGRSHYREIGRAVGRELAEPDEGGRVFGVPDRSGTIAQSVIGISRARLIPIREAYPDDCPVKFDEIARLDRFLRAYKRDRHLMDYADLLDEAPDGIDADVVILDEAQDLTPAQWRYFHRVVRGATRVYVAGDDDQAIYEWAGADVRSFLTVEGRREVLRTSHRLPRRVYRTAARVLSRIGVRQPKDWEPRDDDGHVVDSPDPARVPIGTEGTWLLLARTGFLAARWETVCRDRGLTYVRDGESSVKPAEGRAIRAWETARAGRPVPGAVLEDAIGLAGREVELEPEKGYTLADVGIMDAPIWHRALDRIPAARRRYYEACLRVDKRALNLEPTITVSTIHGAKGAQADRVAIMTDIPPAAEQAMGDAEHRVWYVAATRARQSLYLVRPMGDRQYKFR